VLFPAIQSGSGDCCVFTPYSRRTFCRDRPCDRSSNFWEKDGDRNDRFPSARPEEWRRGNRSALVIWISKSCASVFQMRATDGRSRAASRRSLIEQPGTIYGVAFSPIPARNPTSSISNPKITAHVISLRVCDFQAPNLTLNRAKVKENWVEMKKVTHPFSAVPWISRATCACSFKRE
jgi:hypothetical protein